MVQGKSSFQHNGNFFKTLFSKIYNIRKIVETSTTIINLTGHQCDKTTTMLSLSYHLRWLVAKEMMETLFATIKKKSFAILPLVCFISDLFLNWS
jgi:hypothetical protein